MKTTYVVTSAEDNWGTEPENRFSTQSEAEQRFEQIASTGRYVRLVVWDDHQSNLLKQANEPHQQTTSQG